MNMSLEIRIRELADHYNKATRPELKEQIDLIAYGIININTNNRKDRKIYRDIYFKTKFPGRIT